MNERLNPLNAVRVGHVLKFTGAVTDSFDGSMEKTIQIPTVYPVPKFAEAILLGGTTTNNEIATLSQPLSDGDLLYIETKFKSTGPMVVVPHIMVFYSRLIGERIITGVSYNAPDDYGIQVQLFFQSANSIQTSVSAKIYTFISVDIYKIPIE